MLTLIYNYCLNIILSIFIKSENLIYKITLLYQYIKITING